MAQFWRKKIILAKIETSYGVDSSPTGSANAIVTQNLTRTMYDGTRVQRDVDYPYMANDHSLNTAPFVTLTFSVELARSGTAGTAPAYGPLLRACALSETVIAETSVTYEPVSEDFESVTIYMNVDGEEQKIIGCRGTVTFTMTRNQIPMINFTLTGRYARPTAKELYTPIYTQPLPRPCSPHNTTVFSVFSQAVVGESFTLDLGNEVVHRPMLGAAGVDNVNIVDRAPTANAVFEATPVSTKDFVAAAESHAGTVTEGSLTITHDVISFEMTKSQISNIGEQESDSVRMFALDLIPLPTTGNDEFSIVFTG